MVSFAIRNNLVRQLTELPQGICERLMTVWLKLVGHQMASVVSAYAPTLDSQEDIKEAFYVSLDNILSTISEKDKIILLGEFNTRVGQDYKTGSGIIGKKGDRNSVLLLTKCAEHRLTITNTLLRQKNKFKTSWMHPRFKHRHLTDYVIVRATDRHDVHLTRSITGTDGCWTDHHVIRSTMAIRLMSKRRLKIKRPLKDTSPALLRVLARKF